MKDKNILWEIPKYHKARGIARDIEYLKRLCESNDIHYKLQKSLTESEGKYLAVYLMDNKVVSIARWNSCSLEYSILCKDIETFYNTIKSNIFPKANKKSYSISNESVPIQSNNNLKGLAKITDEIKTKWLIDQEVYTNKGIYNHTSIKRMIGNSIYGMYGSYHPCPDLIKEFNQINKNNTGDMYEEYNSNLFFEAEFNKAMYHAKQQINKNNTTMAKIKIDYRKQEIIENTVSDKINTSHIIEKSKLDVVNQINKIKTDLIDLKQSLIDEETNYPINLEQCAKLSKGIIDIEDRIRFMEMKAKDLRLLD